MLAQVCPKGQQPIGRTHAGARERKKVQLRGTVMNSPPPHIPIKWGLGKNKGGERHYNLCLGFSPSKSILTGKKLN